MNGTKLVSHFAHPYLAGQFFSIAKEVMGLRKKKEMREKGKRGTEWHTDENQV